MTIWKTIIANAFWLTGLAIAIAALSYHYWQAVEREQPLRQQLSTTSFRAAAWGGLTLFCLGLGATRSRGWDTAVWYALALLSVVSLFSLLPWFHRQR